MYLRLHILQVLHNIVCDLYSLILSYYSGVQGGAQPQHPPPPPLDPVFRLPICIPPPCPPGPPPLFVLMPPGPSGLFTEYYSFPTLIPLLSLLRS